MATIVLRVFLVLAASDALTVRAVLGAETTARCPLETVEVRREEVRQVSGVKGAILASSLERVRVVCMALVVGTTTKTRISGFQSCVCSLHF